MKKKTKTIIGTVFAAIAVAGFIAGYVFIKDGDVPFLNIQLNKRTYEKEIIPDHGYRSETTYDGTGDFDEAVYDIPFNTDRFGMQVRKEVKYVNNIEYVKKNGIEKTKKLDAFAKDYMEKLFNTGYRTLTESKDSYVKEIADKTQLMMDPEAFTTLFVHEEDIEEFAEVIVDNKIQCEAEFKTDSSLVYTDFLTTVRGELVIKAYGEDSREISLYRIPLTKDGRYIVDVVINEYDPRVFVLDVVGEITEDGLVEYEPITWEMKKEMRNYD